MSLRQLDACTDDLSRTGIALNSMHRSAIDARVLDNLYKGNVGCTNCDTVRSLGFDTDSSFLSLGCSCCRALVWACTAASLVCAHLEAT